MTQCRAVCREGQRCPREAILDGFCVIHFKMRKKLLKEDKVL